MKGTLLLLLLLCAALASAEKIERSHLSKDRPTVVDTPAVIEETNNIKGASKCQYNGQFLLSEKCNQFSLCVHGLPVTINCPENLVFNPESNTCDWPRNVDCGDRIILVDDVNKSEEAHSDSEDNSANNDGVGVLDTTSIETSAENGEESAEDQNNDDICVLNRAFDGHAYPHEYCHQFYLCAHGTATPMVCPWILLFNTETRRCDWPHNVKCGERTIPVDFAIV